MSDGVRYGPASLNRSYGAPEIENQRRVTLAQLELLPGESVLDVGCGSGFLTAEMATAVGERGVVIAVDKSDDMVAATQERCDGMGQVAAHTADVTALPMTDASFTAVTCTQVLLYVDQVEKALNEMMRVLKPGGRLAVLETDWRGVVMASHYPEITDAIFRGWDNTVPSPNLPTRLLPLMRKAGLENVHASAIPLLNTEYDSGSFSVSSLDWMTATARKQGAITDEEANLWRADLETLGSQGGYFFCVNRFLFVGRKG